MLTAEEAFLWEFARCRRAVGGGRAVDPDLPETGLDWERVVEIAVDNRLPTLLAGYLQLTGLDARLPPTARGRLAVAVKLFDYRTRLFTRALRQFLDHAAARGLPVVVLKGLWLSHKVYGKANSRPGGDVDLLLRRQDVGAALNILEYQMGYGRWWQPLLDDRYYARHHLHQQRCNPGRGVWFEPHWRLDHPYTRLTVDYEAMLARTTAGELLGKPVRELAPADLLLTLVIHLVKHAVYLPATLHRPDLPRLILADGMLVYFLDVAELLQQRVDALDWPHLIELARESGAATMLGAVLRVCARYLGAPVPAEVLAALPVERPGPLSRLLMQGVADQTLAAYAGRDQGRFWRFLAGWQETIIFRPIRLLDFLHHLFPGADYLARRYGSHSPWTAARHLLLTGARYLRVGLDTVYYGWQRRRRLQTLSAAELDRFARWDPLLDEA